MTVCPLLSCGDSGVATGGAGAGGGPVGGGGAGGGTAAGAAPVGGDGGARAGAEPSGGGGGSLPVENCLDGIDGDGDGAVDCEDADCSGGFECVDAPVSGWSGPWLVERVPFVPDAVADLCPNGEPPAIYYAGPSSPGCEPCTCELVGAQCDAPQLNCKNSTSCISIPTLSPDKTNLACQDLSSGPPGGWIACRLIQGSALVTPGVCNASGGGLASPETWAEEVRVCAAAGAGCEAGKACAPKVPASFEPSVCMGHEGASVCPVGWNSLDLTVYAGGTDDRACSSCGCDVGDLHCVGGQYHLFDATGCNPADEVAQIDSNVCESLTAVFPDPPVLSSLLPEAGSPVGEICNPAIATGSVATSGPRQICCRDR